MRIANIEGRAKWITTAGAVDVHAASGARFGPSLPALYDEWDGFQLWAQQTAEAASAAEQGAQPFEPAACGPPSPAPRQVFAVALNYRDHAAEAGAPVPSEPLIFTKYVSAFAAPISKVTLPPGHVDWECELVAVIGRAGHQIPKADAWAHVAGLTVGQDLSERELQRRGSKPQFGLAKSYPGFAPTGPVLVTADEFANPDDLGIGCEVNGQTMQSDRTSLMIFPVAELVAYLSTVVTLWPGDVIFTGTPSGVGVGRNPPVFLAPGDELRSWVEGIGELHQHFVGS
jgi:2-keto-4-pentenoate hydratase/2-oxohepta-3-ene-1,7-dioic acid hydratase in catechol pathway